MNAARFIVRGKVQGVFFRASAREQAVKLKLTGHARNLIDGSVEVVVYGDAAAIDQLEVWLHDGPETADVQELFREDIGAHDAPSGFLTK
ncbi:acylphosphatase [Luteibacter aegosomaticola]|jgi:acylphosphatase|uniref:acylphosphatase n=1 Tax=Luteibacter aegosomaticola TaxID=2911538 RepID=UPI001FFAFEE2|nr:acylphosphatase [Luteibacter aegosomaticola]UPG91398.1 acylphosphatase [Luteibacter aegosomaticola]